eukprot:scpid25799/ scgid32918/ Dicer-like protein 1; Endoribonuclease DCL1; ATP-dependent helicase DCL1
MLRARKKVRCKVCDKTLNSLELFYLHVQGETHKRAARRWKANNAAETPAAGREGAALDDKGGTNPDSTSTNIATGLPRSGSSSQSKGPSTAGSGGSSDKSYWCAVCEKQLTSSDQLKAHEDGKAHLRKVQQQRQQRQQQATNNVDASEAGTSAVGVSVGQGRWKCTVCNVDASSYDNLQAHLAGKQHQKKASQAATLAVGGVAAERHGEFYCSVCKVDSTSQVSYEIHCQGKKHQRSVEKASAAATGSADWDCKICKISCTGQAAYKAHCEGKMHIKKCRDAGIELPACARRKEESRSHPPLVLSPDGQKTPAKLISTKLRDYQLELYKQAMQHNRVLYLPTGMGKTKLGTCVLSHMLQLNPTYQVVFLVDRVLLVVQQANVIRSELAEVRLPGDRAVKVAALCGAKADLDVDMPGGSERDHHIIVATAGCYQNLLVQKVLFWTDVACLVIDEVHHCGKQHPFHVILKKNFLKDNAHKPRLVGLTASPAGKHDVPTTIRQLNGLLSRMEAKLGTVVSEESRQSYKAFLRRAELRCAVVTHGSRHIDETQMAEATVRKEDEKTPAAASSASVSSSASASAARKPPAPACVLSSEEEKFERMLTSIEQYLEEALRAHAGCGRCGKDMADLSHLLSSQQENVKDTMTAVQSMTSRRLSDDATEQSCIVPLQHFQSVARSWLELKHRRAVDELRKLNDASNAFGFNKVFAKKLKSETFIQDYLEDVFATAAATAVSKLNLSDEDLHEDGASFDEDDVDDFSYVCEEEEEEDFDDIISIGSLSDGDEYDDDYFDDSPDGEPDDDDDFFLDYGECAEAEEEELTMEAKQQIVDKVITEILKLPWHVGTGDRPIALVLVERREDARDMVTALNDSPALQAKSIRTLQIIGQRGTAQMEGMTVKKQTEAMVSLHQGRCNIAVCTSVAEEGLDLPSCSLVIKTKLPTTLPSLVQSWGRARAHGATFFVICKNVVEQEKVASLLDRERNMEKAARQLADQGLVV